MLTIHSLDLCMALVCPMRLKYALQRIPRRKRSRLSTGQDRLICSYLDMGLHDIYEVRITRLTPDVQPEQQVEVIVNILNQN